MKTSVVCFPFDLFGSGGAGRGAELLADAFREMLADNQREKVHTRARAYSGKIQLEEFSFETVKDYHDWRHQARTLIRQVWNKENFLIWITGNHLGVLPIYEELGRRKDNLVIQFDGHLDIYNLSDCTSEISHGNFLRHADGPLPGLLNVGHRELLLRPAYVQQYYQAAFSAADVALDPDGTVGKVRQASAQSERVLLDMDCDVLDPAYFPGLAHPLPFGLSPQILLRYLDAAWSGRVVGLAISEFLPARDQDDRSLATLMWLIEHLLLRLYEKA